MVFLLAIAADAFLGVGWVLQQRVAARTRSSDDPPLRVLRGLIATPVWWGGIAAMAAGQSLAAWALQSGAVALVDPLLVGCLLFAFVFAAWRGDERVTFSEVIGTVVVVGGVALFIGVAQPEADVHIQPALVAVMLATSGVAVLAALLVAGGQLSGRRRWIAGQAATFAAGAGVCYALQDVATRGAIDVVQSDALAALVGSAWPYVLLAAATGGVLISQAAFRTARLDWSLPATVAAQPIVAVPMAVWLLGDELRHTAVTIPLELLSLPVTVLGVLIVGRSLALRRAHGLSRQQLAKIEPARQP